MCSSDLRPRGPASAASASAACSTFSFRLLASLVAPCFAAEAAYKAWWYATSADRVPFFANDVLSDVIACSLEMASWMYRSGPVSVCFIPSAIEDVIL